MKIIIGILFIASSLPFIFTADSSSAAAAAASSSSNRYIIPCIKCPAIYVPVCGTDGRTYSNQCILECVNRFNTGHGYPSVKLHRKGPCPYRPCTCPLIWDPVCASNKQTFANKCQFKCENSRRKHIGIHKLFIAREGACKAPLCICPDISIPVCGKDNRTYKNICTLQCSGVKLQSLGACPKEACPSCESIKDEICASDGNTYLNKCFFDCQNRRLENMGQRRITIANKGVCSCICPAVYDPVCASNYKSYKNTCDLGCENRIRKRDGLRELTKLYDGTCIICKCPAIYNPVCATDRNTYSNKCEVECQNLILDRQKKPRIKISHPGHCVSYVCTKIYAPVCASDGKTYNNLCLLNVENEKRIKAGKSKLTVAGKGVCCTCTKEYRPVCNSEYKTNQNECSLKCENVIREQQGFDPLYILYRSKCVCTNCRLCPSNYQPVCGTDRNTYWNLCWINCNITCRPWISIFYHGRCW